jgi:hypothetical protein
MSQSFDIGEYTMLPQQPIKALSMFFQMVGPHTLQHE